MPRQMKYRNYIITYDPPPIPDRSHDFAFYHVDYDGTPNEIGGPPADNRSGAAASVEDAKMQIDEIEAERQDQTRRSPSFAEKLNRRFEKDPIEEEIGMLIDLAGSLNSFQSKNELQEHLAEGSLLNISKIASRALSVPCGDYVVWTTNSGHTMLVPTSGTKSDTEVFEDYGKIYEILTPDLLNHWNTVERVLAEDEYSNSSDDPNFETNQPDEGGKEEDEGKHGGFQSKINMSTVDRSPIVRAMEQHGHTVTSLANAVGVDPPAISRILRTPKNTQGDPGGRNPSIGLAARVANELKMDAEALFPDIFGTPKQDFQARDQPGNRGSGMSQAAHGSMKKGKATQKWTQGNK